MKKKVEIKQRTLPGIGPIYDAFVTSLPFLSAVQFLTILALFYDNVSGTLLNIFPWMSFTIFIVTVAVIMCGVMIIVYKFLLPEELWR